MATRTNDARMQWEKDDGTPAVGYFVYTYVAGTDTPLITYSDFFALSQNTNPVELDAHGSASIYITQAAKFVLKTDLDVTVWTADNLNAQTSDILDVNSNYLLRFTTAANAVNYMNISNAAAGASPILEVKGTDVNIDLTLNGKGTGKVVLGAGTSAGVKLAGNQPILDSSTNELMKFVSTGSAANEITITNNVALSNPIISATGDSTNIGLNFQTKGTGSYGLFGTATQRGQLDLYEQTTNGVNKITFRTPAAITTNHALTFDGGGTDRTLTFGGDFTTGAAFTTVGAFTTGGVFTTTSTFSQTGAYVATAAVSFTGAVTTAGAFTTSGANALTLTTTGPTNVTLPTSGTLLIASGIAVESVKTQTFTGNGTYTPSTGMLYCIIEAVGSGAGGVTTDGTHISSGSGGGSYSKASFTAAQIGASQGVTIGAGGTAGNGGNTTSVGSLITALGGSVGTSITSGAAVGGSGGSVGAISGGTTMLLIPGGDGGPAQFATNGQGSGFGGASFYGMSCKGAASGGSGTAGKNYGGGASGTQNGTASSGAGGIVIIVEFCNQA